MNDEMTTSDGLASDGPIGSRPASETAPDAPSDSPLADAPVDAGPPAGDDSAVETEELAPPLPGEATAGADPDTRPVDDDAAPALVADDAPPVEPPRPEPRRLSRGERESVDRVRGRFAACGRCGYLIADLSLLLGDQEVQEAMIQARDGWLRLEGDERLRGVLNDAFGVRLDLEYSAMDGMCPECRRRFVFASLDDGRARLKLHV